MRHKEKKKWPYQSTAYGVGGRWIHDQVISVGCGSRMLAAHRWRETSSAEAQNLVLPEYLCFVL